MIWHRSFFLHLRQVHEAAVYTFQTNKCMQIKETPLGQYSVPTQRSLFLMEEPLSISFYNFHKYIPVLCCKLVISGIPGSDLFAQVCKEFGDFGFQHNT